MNASPLVSILIPCFNAERWIGQAIQSALDQTWNAKEVIVVDDGSTDSSPDIIKSFEGRVRWEAGANKGGNSARNRLLELSQGEWLQYLDADDYLMPGKIAGQMSFLASAGPSDVVFGPVIMEWVRDTGVDTNLLPIPSPHDIWILLARWYLPQTGAPLWRRQALIDVGGWKVDQPCCQEHELYLRLLMAGKTFRYSDADGAVYRQWGDHTVCKRNLPEVHRRRLEIEDRAEHFLSDTGELSRDRLGAINQARFELARQIWRYDPVKAIDLMDIVFAKQPDFVPEGAAAPRLYQIAFKILGFERAERLADARRRDRRSTRQRQDQPI